VRPAPKARWDILMAKRDLPNWTHCDTAMEPIFVSELITRTYVLERWHCYVCSKSHTVRIDDLDDERLQQMHGPNAKLK
jgi:hypothetical protein